MIKKNKWLFWLLLIPMTELFRIYAKGHVEWVEFTYSRGIYLKLMQGISTFFGMIPISVGEVLVFSYVSILLFMVIQAIGDRINKKRWADLRGILKYLTVSISVIYFLFFLLYGINFYREPLVEINEEAIYEAGVEGLESALNYYIDRASTLAQLFEDELIPSLTYDEIFTISDTSYYYLPLEYRYMNGVYGPPKRLILSDLQASMGYTGMFFMLTGEPLVNSNLIRAEVPFTVTHEIAHQRGVAREYEASYIGFLACIYSENLYFNYSGYFNAIQYLGNELYKIDVNRYNEVMSQCHPGILRDLQSVSDFWKEYYKPELGKSVDVVVEFNLDSHGQDGIASYGQVSQYMLNYYFEIEKEWNK